MILLLTSLVTLIWLPRAAFYLEGRII